MYKGLLLAPQITKFYPELSDPLVKSALCLVHQRFSTNTFPSWPLAHPYRHIAHNGEINTVKGNVIWMNARQSLLESPLFGDDLKKLFPIVVPGGSDSASLDNAVELLLHAGRELPHVMAMLIPEAWSRNPHMDPAKRAFYEYHASLMEPWDGPAAMAFTDGRVIGATLDRNGLRPGRYVVTNDDMVVLASEAGVLEIEPERVKYKGRLQPGRMFLVDTVAGRIISDDEIKADLASRQPYAEWIKQNQITLEQLARAAALAPRQPRDDHPAAAGLRVHGRRHQDHSGADGAERRGAGGFDGRGHAAGLSVGPSAAAVQLLQAAVCAGDQPADRSDPRRPADVADQLHRHGAEHSGGDSAELPHAEAAGAGADQSRPGKGARAFRPANCWRRRCRRRSAWTRAARG